MKFKIDRIISVATLLASLVAIILVLKKPAPVALPQAPAAVAAHAQSFDQKVSQFQQAAQPSAGGGGSQTAPLSSGSSTASSAALSSGGATPVGKAELHLNSDEIGAALTQALGAADGSLSPDTNIGSSAPTIKDQHVSMEGDIAHGQFLTEIAGKDVWITVSGHLGQKDGYATFDPTEFKVGDLEIPVSLVKPALDKKLQEERDRLKLPDYVGDVKVKDSELVMTQK